MVKPKKLAVPIHPGEILREDFMLPMGLSMNRLALDLRVPVTRIAEIFHGRRGDYTRYRLAAGTLFQYYRAFLAESSSGI